MDLDMLGQVKPSPVIAIFEKSALPTIAGGTVLFSVSCEKHKQFAMILDNVGANLVSITINEVVQKADGTFVEILRSTDSVANGAQLLKEGTCVSRKMIVRAAGISSVNVLFRLMPF